jgi:hypothetical protein
VSVSAQLNADQIARAEGIGSGLIGEKLYVKKKSSQLTFKRQREKFSYIADG